MESIADRIRATRQNFGVTPPQKNNELMASPEVQKSNSEAVIKTIEVQTAKTTTMSSFAEKIKSIRENAIGESQSSGSQSSSHDHPYAISRLSHPKIKGFQSNESPHKIKGQSM